MKKTVQKTSASAGDTAVPPSPAPAFSAHQVRTVEPPKRHDGTARTVRYVQAGAEGEAHLYSYAGDYIATVTAAEGEAFASSRPPTPEAATNL